MPVGSGAERSSEGRGSARPAIRSPAAFSNDDWQDAQQQNCRPRRLLAADLGRSGDYRGSARRCCAASSRGWFSIAVSATLRASGSRRTPSDEKNLTRHHRDRDEVSLRSQLRLISTSTQIIDIHVPFFDA